MRVSAYVWHTHTPVQIGKALEAFCAQESHIAQLLRHAYVCCLFSIEKEIENKYRALAKTDNRHKIKTNQTFEIISLFLQVLGTANKKQRKKIHAKLHS